MNRCPITYEPCGESRYSKKGLSLLSRKLHDLKDFPFTQKQQIELAIDLASKFSIQGVQPKLLAKLSILEKQFTIVEKGGTYILKPPHEHYEHLPENEDLTMRLAAKVGLEIPFHGMIYNSDGTLTYFIKRFDRLPLGHKLSVEDFADLLNLSRETKYEGSMEKAVEVIEKFCTFPKIEKLKLFRLSLFSFLAGNEDMHLKNFSLIRREGKTELSPCYDLLNSTIALKNPKEEFALPLRWKKSRFTKEDFFEYFGDKRLKLDSATIQNEKKIFETAYPDWIKLIKISFLTKKLKDNYLQLIHNRFSRLQ